MDASHFTTGARERLRLVEDDLDRRDLLDRLHEELGHAMLAYCVMDTHVHVVVEGPADHCARWLGQALDGYVRAFNRRHGTEGSLLRDRSLVAHEKRDAAELARAIRYVHDNPLKCSPPAAARALDFPWSSQRAFAGLSLAPRADVARARELTGRHSSWAAGWRPALADLEPAAVPCAGPEVLLEAAAEAYEVLPHRLAGPERDPLVTRSRAAFLRLGQIESYTQLQLAGLLNRSPARVCRLLASTPVADDELRVVRTLIRDPGLRRHLARRRSRRPPVAPPIEAMGNCV